MKSAVAFVLRAAVVSSFALHASNRQTAPSSSRIFATHDDQLLSPVPAKVVVVGGGIGGLSTAFDATHILGKQAQVTVVSNQPDFTFVPSNPWVAVGKREPKDIQLPLSRILPQHNIEFIQAAATKLDPNRQRLTLSNAQDISYDFLVIAAGPKLALDTVPGLRDNAVSICTAPHAQQAYLALKALVKSPGPIVVGATQGASCFGPAYEYVMLLLRELHQQGGDELVNQCPVSFVTSEPWIGHMGLGGAGNSMEVVSKLFGAHKMQVYANSRVERVTPNAVVVNQVDSHGHSMGSLTLPSKLTMFIPPFQGHDIWKSVKGLADSKGMILTNEFMQSQKYSNIFAVGVCVHMDPFESTPVPIGIPKTGYMIESMGTAVVQNIQSLIDSKQRMEGAQPNDDLHCKPLLNAVCIADFGDTGAIFVTLPQIPPRHHDFTFTGKIVPAAKVAFEKYFLHKVQTGDTDPYYEKLLLNLMGVERTQQTV